MSERSQHTANRSALLAVGLMVLFVIVSVAGDWEGMIGLALGLMLYFIALLHVPLGIVALVAAYKSGNYWRNLWIYFYFGGFAIAAIGYAAAIGDWDKLIGAQVERMTDPESAALRDALRRFNSDAAAALRAIDEGADVNTLDDRGRTPLMLAANAGFEDVVERLLRDGADPHAVANDGANALHYGAAGGMYRHSDPREFSVNIGVVELLLDAGADASSVDRDGVTPIIGACTAGSIETVSLLREAGADITVKPDNSRGCLLRAVKSGQEAFIRWLIMESGASINAGTALSSALFKRDPEMFALLLELGGDPVWLIQRDRPSLAVRLTGNTPQMTAMRESLIASGRAARAFAAGGYRELQELGRGSPDPERLHHLLAMGVDPNAADQHANTTLHSLARFATGSIGIAGARILIDAGANVDALGHDDRTPLGVAANNGNLETLEFLISEGADVNHTEKHGVTAQRLAARQGYGYIIEALAVAGAELPPPSEQAHYFTESKKHAPAISALIAAGFDPNHPDEYGNLPLFNIISYGEADAVAAMVTGGVRLDVYNSSYSPLTAAVTDGNEKTVDVLITAGGDPNARDRKNRTPIELAIRKRALPTLIVLVRNGARVSKLQRQRIEDNILSEKFRGRGRDRKEELRGML